MLCYEEYSEKIRRLFESAYAIRCSTGSTADELYKADNLIETAVALCSEAEQSAELKDKKNEIVNDRLRCYIERLSVHTRLMKMAYGTERFETVNNKQEQYCLQYVELLSAQPDDDEVRQSLYQLGIMAYQSLAACYFRRGGMGKGRTLCLQAVGYLDKAMELTKGDKYYDVLLANKQQILQAME